MPGISVQRTLLDEIELFDCRVLEHNTLLLEYFLGRKAELLETGVDKSEAKGGDDRQMDRKRK